MRLPGFVQRACFVAASGLAVSIFVGGPDLGPKLCEAAGLWALHPPRGRGSFKYRSGWSPATVDLLPLGQPSCIRRGVAAPTGESWVFVYGSPDLGAKRFQG